ncbi:hypothetical protein F5Y10DRAFT_289769 [Nemania abortiva]|nr:hypothetical protein F5Y10DRAFT_289769 [Nemania abortiva]
MPTLAAKNHVGPSPTPPLPPSSPFNPSADETPSSDENPSPRKPLPGLPPHTPPRRRRRNTTEHEKARGRMLNDNKHGVDARQPCKCCKARYEKCEKQGTVPELRCRVARNPKAFRGYKCGSCIISKGRCCFSVDNPGVPFEPERLEETRAEEQKKRAAREKAAATRAAGKRKQKALSSQPRKI